MVKNEKIVSLHSDVLSDISQVGGKGYSLIKLSQLNMNVPPGIVLTVDFFQEWIEQIKNTDLFKDFIEQLKVDNENTQNILNDIKSWCMDHLKLKEEDLADVENHLKEIFPDNYNKILYAVRSSSPEEDLSGASFAGNYETYLGTQFNSIEKYVLKSFISCLDYRVIKYKSEKGFTASDIKIAIVIMKQINSDVSGIGFSINPINNNFDETVITSNFGLGESVVGGIITPDEYVVDKVSNKIVSQKLGSKKKIVKLNDDNNGTSTVDQNEDKQQKSSLSEEQVMEVVKNIMDIETSYGIPVDIEFSIEDNILYILQARPITTYNKLTDSLITEPGKQKQLYFDVTTGLQGFDKPMSTLGGDIFKIFVHCSGIHFFGHPKIDDIQDGIFDIFGGKMFFNLSNEMSLLPVDKMASYTSNVNTIISETLLREGEKYKGNKNFSFSKIAMARKLPIMRILFPSLFAKSTKANVEYYMKEYMTIYDKKINENLKSKVPISTVINEFVDKSVIYLRDYITPAAIIGLVFGYIKIKDLFEPYFKENPELFEKFNNLTKCFPFVTIQMGLDIYKLSTHFDKNDYINKTQEDFYDDFVNKTFPKEFYDEFENFMKKYGFRGDGELDVYCERYSDNPKSILNQIFSSLLNHDENNNPQKDYDETNLKRPEVYQELYQFAKKKGFASKFKKAYKLMVLFFQYREDIKYYIIFMVGKIRELILSRANGLLEKGLFKKIDDVFELKVQNLSDIEEHADDYTMEKVYEQIAEDCKERDIFSTWSRSPVLFDSRGKIFSKERKSDCKKNELVGDTVSFGKVRGKAKILMAADEKVFNPGEILVTKSTDPGWTPLIINSGGIVLEIGGMLQHGALVSREFNKPCVVGVENATSIIKDGEEIEVDAVEGIVRLLDREEE
ncbi:hypothetical protein PIROE2DRAFT_14623 [Piromyces sp. E2]|nr:hypothetical protein PIROE2DRAFT_14623 [Piromyces sp. E2]|eukprot:OUM59753.1 hypothetical protein PIROE2DRAFT_14623 [Piromyces sp. E2]